MLPVGTFIAGAAATSGFLAATIARRLPRSGLAGPASEGRFGGARCDCHRRAGWPGCCGAHAYRQLYLV